MATLLGDARIRIRPDMSGFRQTVDREVETSGRQAQKHASSVGKSLSGAAGMIAGVALIEGFKSVTEAARESQKVAADTANVIRTTGGAAKVSADQVAELAGAISKKTGIDDEAIQSGENMLLTFTNIRNEAGKGNDIFNQTSSIMVDVAAKMGTDTPQAAIQLGKALNDPIKGVTALTRIGVTFDDQQRKQIKTLVQSGKTMDAQKIILAELSKEFGGSAEAMATPADKLNVSLGNLAEDIGTALMPAADKLANVLIDDVIPAASGFLGVISNIPGPVLAGVAGVVGLVGAVKLGKTAFEGIKEVVDVAQSVIGVFTTKTAAAAVAEEAEAVAADSAAAATTRFGAASGTAANFVGKLGSKAILGGAIVGLAALSTEATGWLGRAEVADTDTNKLADSFIHLRDGAKAPSEAIKLVSNDFSLFGDDVETGDQVMQRFADTARGAFGDGMADVIGRAQSGSERMDRFSKMAEQADGALAVMVQQGHASDAVAFLDELRQKTGMSDGEFQHVINHLPKYNALMGGATQATSQQAVAAANAAYQQSQLDQKTQQVTEAQKTLDDAVKTINNSLQVSNNRFLVMRGAENGVQAALDDLTDSIKTNGKTLDVHTAKGRANRTALDNVAGASLAVLNAQSDNVKASPKFQTMMDHQRDLLITAAEKFGMSKTAARKYADQVLQTPQKAVTQVSLKDLAKVKKDLTLLQLQITALKGKNLEVVIDSHGNAILHDNSHGHGGMATGGLVRGPGSGTSDSIPTRLSNGEFVVNAKSTSAHRELLEAINARGYATGGIVSRSGPITVKTSDQLPQHLTSDILSQVNPMNVLGMGGGGSIPGGGSGVRRWYGVILTALRMLGQSANWLPVVASRMNRESGGNPNAINLWDSNAKAGYPSRGLMQTIPGTFNAYAGPLRGRGITDPLANTYAGLNYAIHRYGSLAALSRPGGYAGGTLNASPGWHKVGENGPELVRFRGGESVKSHEQSFGQPIVNVTIMMDGKVVQEITDAQVDISYRKLAQAVSRGRR